MGYGPYGDDSMSDEDYEQVMDQMMELQNELQEPHDAATDRMIREELEGLSSAMLFEPVMENGRFVGYRDHEPGYWTDKRDQPDPEPEPESVEVEAASSATVEPLSAQQAQSAEIHDPTGYASTHNSAATGGGSGCLYLVVIGFIAFLVFIGILDTIYDHVLVPAGFAMRRIDFQQFVIFGFIILWLVVRHMVKKRKKRNRR